MSKIQESLTRLFQDHRIIFWYDEKGELQEEFENFSLPDVEKIKIDNNEFAIKYRVVHRPETKFLIYSDRPKPQDGENWLLDLNLANYEFSADRAALIAQELGLSWEHKQFVAQHLDFFKSQKRTEQLQQFLEEGDDQHQIALKMLAVLTGADPDIEKILYELFVDLDEGKGEKYQNIVKFNLVTFFWKIIQHKYNYHSDNPTLKDFLVQLLVNHFQTNLASPQKVLNKEAAVFVNHWMDSARYHLFFDSLSDKIARELDIGKELESLDFRELLSADTYKLIDSKIIFDLKQGIEGGTLNFMGVQEIIRKRETKHWFSHYRHLYQALYFAAKLKDLHQSLRLTIETLEEGFRNYLKKFYQFDYAYRKYIYHASNAEHLDVLKSLTALVENIYINSYLLKISDRWQQLVDQCKSWKIAGFHPQKEFYQHFVKLYLKADKKIFVIIADGLRYESAVELTGQLLQEDGYQAELKALVGQIPSYTKLGMAALLPNSKLSFNDRSANVFVDDLSSSSIEDRSKILQKYQSDSVAIQAENFLNMKREEGRQFTKQYKVIYIYHNEIDAVGDNPKSESQVFDAVEKEFELIKKLIRQIINFNGTNVLITADHGFLYQHSDIKESDFCKVEKSGEVFFSNRRCIVGKKLTGDSCVKKFTGNELGIQDEIDVLLAKSINRIRIQGGGSRYVHGGATLPEIAIPVIQFSRKRRSDVRRVEVDIIKSQSRITTNRLPVSFLQTEPVGEKILPRELKIGIYSKDGELISDEVKLNFSSDNEDARGREQKHNFILKSSASRFNNQSVYLRMLEKIEGTNQYKLYKEDVYILKISFTSEFDEF